MGWWCWCHVIGGSWVKYEKIHILSGGLNGKIPMFTCRNSSFSILLQIDTNQNQQQIMFLWTIKDRPEHGYHMWIWKILMFSVWLEYRRNWTNIGWINVDIMVDCDDYPRYLRIGMLYFFGGDVHVRVQCFSFVSQIENPFIWVNFNDLTVLPRHWNHG